MTEIAKPLTRMERFRGACARVYIYMIDRILEPSTLRGIVMALAGLGMAFNLAKIEHILTIATIIAGLLGALMPDRFRRSAQRTKEAE